MNIAKKKSNELLLTVKKVKSIEKNNKIKPFLYVNILYIIHNIELCQTANQFIQCTGGGKSYWDSKLLIQHQHSCYLF